MRRPLSLDAYRIAFLFRQTLRAVKRAKRPLQPEALPHNDQRRKANNKKSAQFFGRCGARHTLA